MVSSIGPVVLLQTEYRHFCHWRTSCFSVTGEIQRKGVVTPLTRDIYQSVLSRLAHEGVKAREKIMLLWGSHHWRYCVIFKIKERNIQVKCQEFFPDMNILEVAENVITFSCVKPCSPFCGALCCCLLEHFSQLPWYRCIVCIYVHTINTHTTIIIQLDDLQKFGISWTWSCL